MPAGRRPLAGRGRPGLRLGRRAMAKSKKAAAKGDDAAKGEATPPGLGVAGGAAAGAAAGSLLGPLGAAVGAVVGGVGGPKKDKIAEAMPESVKKAGPGKG